MQGGGNRPYLGKRSSFSNFSPYRGAGGMAAQNGTLQDQMLDSPPKPRQHFASYGGPPSSNAFGRANRLEDYAAGGSGSAGANASTNTAPGSATGPGSTGTGMTTSAAVNTAVRGHSHSHSHSYQQLAPPHQTDNQFSNGTSGYYGNLASTSQYPSNPNTATPGHPLYSTYNHHTRRNAYYESHWPLYAADWTSVEYASTDIVAVGTFSEDRNTNKIQILHATKPTSESLQLTHTAEAVVAYPATKIAWEPNQTSTASSTPAPSTPSRLRMISTGDCLRLWDYDYDTHKLIQRSALLNVSHWRACASGGWGAAPNPPAPLASLESGVDGPSSSAKRSTTGSGAAPQPPEADRALESTNRDQKSKSEFLPPLTSFDWNKIDTSLVITSSIDTTCTIWDINTSTARTQLIAHDSEVNDVAYVANSVDIFASVGADGSVRVFDLRSLDHSTIIYEPANPVPLLRISANPQDRNVLAAIAQDSNKIFVLDIRFPGVPIATLEGHQKPVNAISWAPATGKNGQRRHILASGADDCQVLVWDVTSQQQQQQQQVQQSQQQQQQQQQASTVSPTSNSASLDPLAKENAPIYSFTNPIEVNNISWCATAEWLGIISGKGVQAVRFA
ncbi:hypothetical protein AWJ20_5281 [Sugiyamaella lignohabitans]|uniref:Uncharacterized protein n=1 Tax=Sugiyamaella lignohabitans TaxID=796027 RepID=A0A167EPP1_9ASCO|nr:uncharacterized protein AWJ20_5281 [Sugiyamaella lignohabitans]ANB14316.1 hypothetical protein AWJ20_5281 [Sugiyamaella lignohabitans]